jgi:hypothetical protein
MSPASSSRTCVAVVTPGTLKIGNAEALVIRQAPLKATASIAFLTFIREPHEFVRALAMADARSSDIWASDIGFP